MTPSIVMWVVSRGTRTDLNDTGGDSRQIHVPAAHGMEAIQGAIRQIPEWHDKPLQAMCCSKRPTKRNPNAVWQGS